MLNRFASRVGNISFSIVYGQKSIRVSQLSSNLLDGILSGHDVESDRKFWFSVSLLVHDWQFRQLRRDG